MLPLPLIAAAFAAGYWTSPPSPHPEPTPDLASSAEMRGEDLPANDSAVVISEPGTKPAGTIQRARDGLFYVMAKVNGRPIRFLVDTGASVVVLSHADAQTVGALPRSGRYGSHMATAGGDRPMAWTKLNSVHVAGREVRGVTAAVIHGGPQVSLLGQNLLAKLGAVRIEGDRLAFEKPERIY